MILWRVEGRWVKTERVNNRFGKVHCTPLMSVTATSLPVTDIVRNGINLVLITLLAEVEVAWIASVCMLRWNNVFTLAVVTRVRSWLFSHMSLQLVTVAAFQRRLAGLWRLVRGVGNLSCSADICRAGLCLLSFIKTSGQLVRKSEV